VDGKPEPTRPMTRLGRVVDATATMAALPPHRERHRQTNPLRDVILGGQDGRPPRRSGRRSPTSTPRRGPRESSLSAWSIPYGLSRQLALHDGTRSYTSSPFSHPTSGVYSAVTLVGDWRRSGVKMVVIGLGAAAVGFLIGRLFHATGA